MSNVPSLEQLHLAAPIGQQLSVHLDRRAAVRRATPLLPRSWAELLAPWRQAFAAKPADTRGRHERLSSQSE